MAISKEEYQLRMKEARTRLIDKLHDLAKQSQVALEEFKQTTTQLSKAWNGLIDASELPQPDETSMLSLMVDYESDIWKELEEEAGPVIEGWLPPGGDLGEEVEQEGEDGV